MTSPHLQWRAPDGSEQTFLISSPEVLIGRKRDADIVIPNLNVSRVHAKVVSIPNGHQIVDLGSTYGTFVNSERIESRVLSNGDRITFGKDEVELALAVTKEVLKAVYQYSSLIAQLNARRAP